MSAELINAIKRAAGTHDADGLSKILCTVDSVDRDSRTCNVTPVSDGNDVQIPDVKLMVNVNDGLFILPATGSEVIVTIVKKKMDTLCFVSMFSEIDAMYICANDIIEFNAGTHDGLVKVKELTTKLNNLEDAFNKLILLYNAHTHAVSGAVTLIPNALDTDILIDTLQSEIENTKVTH